MASDRDMRQNVASYLARHGWAAGQSGRAGELWTLDDADILRRMQRDEPLTLAVPFEIEANSFEYESIVSRLARQESQPTDAISVAVESEFLDTQNYRISDQYVVEESALLDSAATVLGSARKLVRAAATTARKPRAHIGTNYSRPGDELALRARLSHTRHGSFVVPIVMPVAPVPAMDGQFDNGVGPVEPGERGVTRTLASALVALDSIAVKPAKEPGPDEVMKLVQSGVSKELVAAVREIAVKAGIEAFDVSFTWSPALGKPRNIPDRVVITDDAAPILNRVVQELGQMKPEPDASVSGQIVRIHYVQDEPFGEIAIRTERKNRAVDVSVTASADVIHDAYVWARDHRSILARGRIERSPGRPLSIPRPTSILPIDTLFAGE